jgi:GNAT superfamily N-acetyltransferase
MRAAVVIREVDPLGADAMALLREAAQDARALYPESFTDQSLAATNQPKSERSAYLVAYVGEVPLACGAIVPYGATTAEVRRMYVHREHRRLGLAHAVLSHLLALARQFGYGRLVLETGFRQTAAMQLYEAAGFERIAPFGKYADDPTSVCYELLISEV